MTRADGGVVSAGVLSVDASGFVSPVLAAPSEEDEGIAVTIEPEGGSEHPTSEPVMAMPVAG
nr:anti-sigma factor [Nocardiopsis alba]